MVPPGKSARVRQPGRWAKLVDLRSQACGDWISFTVVTNLALSASGVGMESCPDSPEELIVLHPILYTTFYNLNILLMALHEHPTSFQPTSTTIRLVLPFITLYHCNLHVQLLSTWYTG